MRTMSLRACAISFIAVLPVTAVAQQLPNETDLKAAYCLGVANSMIETYQQVVSALSAQKETNQPAIQSTNDWLASVQQKASHIQRYLVPRLSYLDLTAIAAAKVQAVEDIANSNQLAEQCAPKCSSPACLDQCFGETGARIRRCSDTAWLPF